MSKVHFINASAVRSILDDAQKSGQIFTVEARKKDSLEITKQNGKIVASPPSWKNKPELVAIERSRSKQIRGINVNRVVRIAGNGQEYKVKSSLSASL